MIWATEEETRHTDPHPAPIAGSARHQAAGGRIQLAKVLDLVTTMRLTRTR